MMVLLLLTLRLLGAAAWTERVRKLGYRKNAPAMELLALLLRHAGQQAELVLLDCFPAAARLEFALATMPVQHEVWRLTEYKSGDPLDALAHLVGQKGGLYFQHVVITTVHDLPDTQLASKFFGEHECVGREQQFVFLGDFVDEFETIGRELLRSAPTLQWFPFHSVQAGFQIVRLHGHVNGETPVRVLEILSDGRRDCALALGNGREQAIEPTLPISFVLRASPLRICIR